MTNDRASASETMLLRSKLWSRRVCNQLICRSACAFGVGCLLLLVMGAGLLTGCGDDDSSDGVSAKNEHDRVEGQQVQGQHAHKAGDGKNADISEELQEQCVRTLGKFLNNGPMRGTWRQEQPMRDVRLYVANHPTQPGVVLLADCIKESGEPCNPCPVSEWRLARFFFKPDAYLFFINYKRSDDVVCETLDVGDDAIRLTWVAKKSKESQVRRCVWFSTDGKHVLRIEDHTANGHVLKRVTYLDDGTGPFNPATLGEKALSKPAIKGSSATAHEISRALAAPFPIYEPTYLPKGYVRIRADYKVAPLVYETPSCCESEDDPNPPKNQEKVRMATLLYSDGVGLISIGFAPPSDMDALRSFYAAAEEAADRSEACAEAAPIKLLEGGDASNDEAFEIHMRRNACRTVLSCEDLPGVHARLISRSELDVDEYLRVFKSLKRVKSE